MGWSTIYKLHLSEPIKNWDRQFVENKCKNYTSNIRGIFYMEYQYKDEYIIHVNIKYGKDEIVKIAEFISNKYNVDIKIEIKKTDINEFAFCNDIDGLSIDAPKKTKPKTNSKWVLIETYYKHGDYQLHIFNTDEELRLFIDQHLEEIHYDDNYINLKDLIKKVIEIGQQRIENQEGWGIREVRKITN
jgi:hypothetical protein